MKYTLSNDTWGREELAAAQAVLHSGRFTMGEQVAAYEQAFALHFGAKYAVMSNSGSSANLLAVACLVYSGRLQPGDEVLVPAVSWSTTFYPIAQMGLKLRLVDIDIGTLNIDAEKLAMAITPKTKALFAVNLLGNPNDFDKLSDFCKAHNLIMFEDNCESMGASYRGKMAGTFGVVGTFSSFYSHHICTMEGGITLTDDEELYHYMLSIRAHGWTRQLPTGSSIYSKGTDEFYESFNFIVPGFNLRPLEIEAAIGLEQLKKLDGFIAQRRANAEAFVRLFSRNPAFMLQQENGCSAWFGFSFILTHKAKKTRKECVAALREAGIEVRPIVAGNFARQKVFEQLDAAVSGSLNNADNLHENGFFVGNHSIGMKKELEYLHEVLVDI